MFRERFSNEEWQNLNWEYVDEKYLDQHKDVWTNKMNVCEKLGYTLTDKKVWSGQHLYEKDGEMYFIENWTLRIDQIKIAIAKADFECEFDDRSFIYKKNNIRYSAQAMETMIREHGSNPEDFELIK